jgi:hypothetical protein
MLCYAMLCYSTVQHGTEYDTLVCTRWVPGREGQGAARELREVSEVPQDENARRTSEVTSVSW